MLSGWFSLYFVSGIFLALGLDAIIELLVNPRPIDFYIELVLGLLLIWLAVKMIRDSDPRRKQTDYGEADQLSTGKSFVIGLTINLIGLPFAIPYFAVLDQILKSDLDWLPAIIVLLIYNLLYILPFSILLVIRYIYREKSDRLFALINEKMEKVGNVLLPLILFLVAGALVADAITYFITSESLF